MPHIQFSIHPAYHDYDAQLCRVVRQALECRAGWWSVEVEAGPVAEPKALVHLSGPAKTCTLELDLSAHPKELQAHIDTALGRSR